MPRPTVSLWLMAAVILLSSCKPGDEVVLTISRGTDVRKVSVTLAPRPSLR
jgi:S1-C subfamily serine protease